MKNIAFSFCSLFLVELLAGTAPETLAQPTNSPGAPAPAGIAAATSSNSLPRPEFYMPGMQPKEAGIDLGEVATCRKCHADTKNDLANDPDFSWEGGMMAQAARDPVFRAALAVANQDIAGVGEFCIRCHSPRAWLAGRSTAPDGSSLDREDLNGVSCVVCHRLVDPRSPAGQAMVKQAPPGIGNGMYVADPQIVERGPYVAAA